VKLLIVAFVVLTVLAGTGFLLVRVDNIVVKRLILLLVVLAALAGIGFLLLLLDNITGGS
jgi:hypothetical protein